jgi:hypothetical protein
MATTKLHYNRGMTAAGEELSLAFIASGKTMRVEESEIGAVGDIGVLTPKAGDKPQKRLKAT